jgi:hypothetical protein
VRKIQGKNMLDVLLNNLLIPKSWERYKDFYQNRYFLQQIPSAVWKRLMAFLTLLAQSGRSFPVYCYGVQGTACCHYSECADCAVPWFHFVTRTGSSISRLISLQIMIQCNRVLLIMFHENPTNITWLECFQMSFYETHESNPVWNTQGVLHCR